MHTITITFEEIPSVLIDGASGGYVDGRAEIEFTAQAQWEVTGISLQLSGRRGTRLIPLNSTEHPQLYCHLVDTIGDTLRIKIESEIDEYFDRLRDEAA